MAVDGGDSLSLSQSRIQDSKGAMLEDVGRLASCQEAASMPLLGEPASPRLKVEKVSRFGLGERGNPTSRALGKGEIGKGGEGNPDSLSGAPSMVKASPDVARSETSSENSGSSGVGPLAWSSSFGSVPTPGGSLDNPLLGQVPELWLDRPGSDDAKSPPGSAGASPPYATDVARNDSIRSSSEKPHVNWASDIEAPQGRLSSRRPGKPTKGKKLEGSRKGTRGESLDKEKVVRKSKNKKKVNPRGSGRKAGTDHEGPVANSGDLGAESEPPVSAMDWKQELGFEKQWSLQEKRGHHAAEHLQGLLGNAGGRSRTMGSTGRKSSKLREGPLKSASVDGAKRDKGEESIASKAVKGKGSRSHHASGEPVKRTSKATRDAKAALGKRRHTLTAGDTKVRSQNGEMPRGQEARRLLLEEHSDGERMHHNVNADNLQGRRMHRTTTAPAYRDCGWGKEEGEGAVPVNHGLSGMVSKSFNALISQRRAGHQGRAAREEGDVFVDASEHLDEAEGMPQEDVGNGRAGAGRSHGQGSRQQRLRVSPLPAVREVPGESLGGALGRREDSLADSEMFLILPHVPKSEDPLKPGAGVLPSAAKRRALSGLLSRLKDSDSTDQESPCPAMQGPAEKEGESEPSPGALSVTPLALSSSGSWESQLPHCESNASLSACAAAASKEQLSQSVWEAQLALVEEQTKEDARRNGWCSWQEKLNNKAMLFVSRVLLEWRLKRGKK